LLQLTNTLWRMYTRGVYGSYLILSNTQTAALASHTDLQHTTSYSTAPSTVPPYCCLCHHCC
jgi:hypothetical protein